MQMVAALIFRAVRAVRILARDGGIPRWLRWFVAAGLLPVPGPFDEAVLLLAALILFAFYRQQMLAAWRQADAGRPQRSWFRITDHAQNRPPGQVPVRHRRLAGSGGDVTGGLPSLDQLFEIRGRIEQLLQAGEPLSSARLVELGQRHDDLLAAISEHAIVPICWEDDWSWRNPPPPTAPNPNALTHKASVAAGGESQPPASGLRAHHSLLHRSVRAVRNRALVRSLVVITLLVLIFTALPEALGDWPYNALGH